MRALALALAVAACGGATPATHYYALATPAAPAPAHGASPPAAPAASAAPAIAIETFAADPPYDDERIVYRTDPYRVDYYEYHRWSASPGMMVADYLARAFERTGQFRAVLRGSDTTAPLALGGHIDAIEEIDVAPQRWVGHVAVQLTATDRASGDVVWTQRFDETEPLPAQTPEGLARALSVAMGRIVARAAPVLAKLDTARAAAESADAADR